MTNPFARLEELSAQLNVSSDTVTETIKCLETKLATLRLGVSVWLKEPLAISAAEEGDTALADVRTWLGYSKINGKWCLAIKHNLFEVTSGLEDLEPSPLQQASREYRVKALRRIPELIKALETAAEAELQNVRMAITITENV